MVHHQVIDVLVFTLFDLVNLNFHTQGQFAVQVLDLVFVGADERLLVLLESVLEHVEVLLALSFLALNLADICPIVAVIFILGRLLIGAVFAFGCAVVLVFVGHDFETLSLHSIDVLLVLIVVMLDFLLMRDNERIMILFLSLHLCVEVLNLRFEFFDLLARIHVEVMNHVLFDLKSVALHLGIAELLS